MPNEQAQPNQAAACSILTAGDRQVGQAAAVELQRAPRHVDARHAHASVQQVAHGLNAVRGGADGDDDLGGHRRESGAALRRSFNFETFLVQFGASERGVPRKENGL